MLIDKNNQLHLKNIIINHYFLSENVVIDDFVEYLCKGNTDYDKLLKNLEMMLKCYYDCNCHILEMGNLKSYYYFESGIDKKKKKKYGLETHENYDDYSEDKKRYIHGEYLAISFYYVFAINSMINYIKKSQEYAKYVNVEQRIEAELGEKYEKAKKSILVALIAAKDEIRTLKNQLNAFNNK